jgi:hypothetical protein
VSEIAAIDRALLPAAVRDGTQAQRDAYTAALGFEHQLVTQLAEQLSRTTGAGDESSAATSAMRDQVPGLLADAVVQGGGLGIAAQIAASLAPAGQSATPGSPAEPEQPGPTSDPSIGASAA